MPLPQLGSLDSPVTTTTTYFVTGQTTTDKTTRWTAAYRPITRQCIDRQFHGPAMPLIAASSTTSDDLTSSSRHLASCRQRPQYLMLVLDTFRTPRPSTYPARSRGSAGAVSPSVDSWRRCVRLVNVEYRSGRRETLLALAARAMPIITRSVLGDIGSYTTVPYLQLAQVLLPIIQLPPTRTGKPSVLLPGHSIKYG